MSATNRGAVRRADDFYITPPWATRAIIPVLKELCPAPANILDPGAGTGSISCVLREEFPEARLLCVEKDPRRVYALRYQGFETHWDSYLRWTNVLGGANFDLVVANPPYTLARPFVERSLRWASEGHVAMLLGLSFMGSKRRREWHEENRPDVYVLSQRPSFLDDGKTDARDYAWFIWGPTTTGSWHSLECPDRKRKHE